MEMNMSIIIIVVIGAILLVIYLISQNKKDEKDFGKTLKTDFKKNEEKELNNED